ncbi:hypothetical protein [Streptomyces sp. NPDC001843]|uniref:hypothetical protein n=1 Tax=Streptomyces sp. NPDC001843 TaxID=3364617 RepID=UPI0036BF77AD
MKPEELREQLLAAAHSTPPLDIDIDHVQSRVRRRRRVQYAAVAGAGLAVAASVVLGTVHSTPPPQVNTPADSVSRQPRATSGAAPSGTPADTPPARHYTCGGTVPAPSGRGAVTAHIAGVRKAPGGAPQITYTVTATAPSVLQISGRTGGPRTLVLKQGRIVAGQDLPRSSATRAPADENTPHQLSVDPARPYRAQLPPMPGRPCTGTSWSSMWKGGYEVVVVLTTQNPVISDTPAPDPVIVARAPLAE